MARATKAEKARLLNAAYRLLGQRDGTRRGGPASRPGVRVVAPAGLPLSPGSGRPERPGTGGRADRRGHLQVAGQHRTRNPRIRPTQRTLPRPGRHPGSDGAPEHRPSTTWVNDNPGKLSGRCISTTRSIDFSSASWPTPTRCWCRPARVRLPPTEWSAHMQMAAIYTRVSSERQREAHTIASQTAALVEWATTLDLEVPRDWIFEDDGYSGATLERPGLERVRDLAAGGDIEVVLVHSPDRLSRKVRLPGAVDRRARTSRGRDALPQCPVERHRRGSTAGAVSGHDRRVRTRPDPRTVSAGETAPRASGRDQRHERRPVWLPLSSEARRCTGLVRRRRGRSARRARHLRALHRHGLEHRGESAGGSTSKAWPRGRPGPAGGPRR